MIKFFRKIRKKLADDNKPIKYMRYAIGEIALVVVGILIALSINNWNEERKSKIKTIQNIEALCEDLQRDSTHFTAIIKTYESKIQELNGTESCFDLITDNRPFKLCLATLMAASQSFEALKNTDRTVQHLKTSGGIEKLDAEDVTMVLDYDHFFIDYKEDEKTVFQETQTLIRNITSKIVNFKALKNGKLTEAELLITQDKLMLNEFFNALKRYRTYCRNNLSRLKTMESEARRIRIYFREKYDLE